MKLPSSAAVNRHMGSDIRSRIRGFQHRCNVFPMRLSQCEHGSTSARVSRIISPRKSKSLATSHSLENRCLETPPSLLLNSRRMEPEAWASDTWCLASPSIWALSHSVTRSVIQSVVSGHLSPACCTPAAQTATISTLWEASRDIPSCPCNAAPSACLAGTGRERQKQHR